MDINTMFFYEAAKFMHSIHNDYSPEVFENYFDAIQHSYNKRTRNTSYYRTPQPRTERGKKSIKYRGVEVWTLVPENLRSLSSKQFNYHLKELIFSTGIQFNIFS